MANRIAVVTTTRAVAVRPGQTHRLEISDIAPPHSEEHSRICPRNIFDAVNEEKERATFSGQPPCRQCCDAANVKWPVRTSCDETALLKVTTPSCRPRRVLR